MVQSRIYIIYRYTYDFVSLVFYIIIYIHCVYVLDVMYIYIYKYPSSHFPATLSHQRRPDIGVRWAETLLLTLPQCGPLNGGLPVCSRA